MKKQSAAYQVHLSAVKNTQRENKGIDRIRKPKPAYTNVTGLRNANKKMTTIENMMS